MRVEGALADSGAQLTIILASCLRAGRINLCNVKTPKVELSAANRVKMNILGVVNAHINATSPSGKQFRTTSKVYVVSNMDNCNLYCDVLRPQNH